VITNFIAVISIVIATMSSLKTLEQAHVKRNAFHRPRNGLDSYQLMHKLSVLAIAIHLAGQHVQLPSKTIRSKNLIACPNVDVTIIGTLM
jgi:hypothetical protein